MSSASAARGGATANGAAPSTRPDHPCRAGLELLPREAWHCFEFRHPSWFVPEVYELLEEHGASLALGDDLRQRLPDASPVGPIAYLRLHYGSRGRNGNYSESELAIWHHRIAFAPRNALTLRGASPVRR